MKKIKIIKFLGFTPLLVTSLISASCNNNSGTKYDFDNLSTWGKTQKDYIVSAYIAYAKKWRMKNTEFSWLGWITAFDEATDTYNNGLALADGFNHFNSLINFSTRLSRNVDWGYLNPPSEKGVSLAIVLSKGITVQVTAVPDPQTPLANKISGDIEIFLQGSV